MTRHGGADTQLFRQAVRAGLAIGVMLAPAARAAEGTGLEEVVVTAQRREENLQRVPIAVSSFEGNELERMRVQTVEDLALKTPNFTLVPQASGNTTYGIAMRGLALTDSVITADSPVGIYVDGVVISKMAGGVFDFVDLERVEVLRGPQGTLYGRNTPAGAINLVSRKPSGDFGAEVQVGIGNYSLREARFGLDTGAAKLGTLGTLSARISGRFLERDGWARDLSINSDLDSRSRSAGRIALRWDVNDLTRIDYSFDKIDIDERPPAAQLIRDFSGFLGSFASPTRLETFRLSYGLTPAAGALGIGASKTRLSIDTHTLTAERKLGSARLKSITGYRKLRDEEPTDFDGSPVAWADFNVFQKLKTFSEELQLLGDARSGALSYVTGLYYYSEEASVRAPGVFGFGTVAQEPRFRTDNSAYAAYGQLDWRPAALDQKLTLTAGLRYTSEDRKMLDHHVYLTMVGGPTNFDLTNVARVSKTFTKTTPSITAAYQLTPDVNVYARYAEGWRSGGFNGRSSDPTQVRSAFRPESLKSYELGLKSLTWERRLQLNAAGFLSKYTDLQAVITAPASTGIGFSTLNDNVGKIDISGIELEARLMPVDAVTLGLTYAYLDTDTKDYTICVPGAGGSGCTFRNLRNERVIPLITRNSGAASLDYRALTLSGGAKVRLHVDANYHGKSIGGGQTLKVRPMEADPSFIPSYTLINARLSLQELKIGPGQGEIGLWGQNLSDRDTAQFAVNLADSLGIATARFLTPRTYGFDFRYQF